MTKLIWTLTLIILTFHLFGQNKSLLCADFKFIDKNEFKRNITIGGRFSKSTHYKKVKTKLSVSTKNNTFCFTDKYDKIGTRLEYYFIHGVDTSKNWVIVGAADEISTQYYIINTSKSTIDTAFGEPMIFDNKMISVEEEYTDGGDRIQLWNIDGDKLTLTALLQTHSCEKIRGIYKWYYKDNSIYFSYSLPDIEYAKIVFK